ncbi:hypothetical protein A0H81_02386 [Grifola frondosa]|uniref:Uncharacterized protein n=1 Tax=Grifola frondosa TaxID=5627 RepID=A0A1C7MMX0_GRIFR|nr:hypothetical protein A0H81_02386 [Grifola frondosa]
MFVLANSATSPRTQPRLVVVNRRGSLHDNQAFDSGQLFGFNYIARRLIPCLTATLPEQLWPQCKAFRSPAHACFKTALFRSTPSRRPRNNTLIRSLTSNGHHYDSKRFLTPSLAIAKQMTDAFPIAEGQLVGLFSGCILYGIYLVTVGISLRLLLSTRDGWKARSTMKGAMLTIVILMAIFATLDVAVRLRYTLYVFIWWAGPGNVQQLLEDKSHWTNIVANVDYVAETVIGDCMLVYRCFVVYGRRWWIILPSILLVAVGIICGILTIYIGLTLNTSSFANLNTLWSFGCSGIAITLALNIFNTSMIAYRIWSINKQTADLVDCIPRGGHSRLKTVIHAVVDSGILYTTSVGVFAGSYFSNSSISDVIACMIIPIVGIAFNLIIIRVHWQATATDATTLSQFQCAPVPVDQGRFSVRLATTTVSDMGSSRQNTVDVHMSPIDSHNISADDSTRLEPGTIV